MSGQVTAGRGHPQQANPAQIMTASVTLSSAQILAADTVPIAVVPASGPGRVCNIITSFYQLVFGTAAYVGGPGGLLYGDDTGGTADSGDNSIMINTESSLTASFGDVANTLAQMVNLPVVYGVPTGSTPYTEGDGTLRITVLYVIEDVS